MEGRIAEAAEHYHHLLREAEHSDADVVFEFAEMVIRAGWASEFQSATRELERLQGKLAPNDQFRCLLARARLATRQGQEEAARTLALAGVRMLARSGSLWSQNPGSGVIHTTERDIYELEVLAGARLPDEGRRG